MYSATIFWLAVIVALLTGVAAGAFVLNWLNPNQRKNRDAERELDAMRQEQQHYRDQVTTHFRQTAELINELTASYRAVHNHLAQGVSELCPGDQSPLAILPEPRSLTPEPAPIEPPRDYAPRGKDKVGPLHEAYGIDKTRRHEEPVEPPRH